MISLEQGAPSLPRNGAGEGTQWLAPVSFSVHLMVRHRYASNPATRGCRRTSWCLGLQVPRATWTRKVALAHGASCDTSPGSVGLEGETAVRLLLQMLSGRAALFLHVPRSMQENPSFASRAVVENLSILQFIPKGESYKTTSCRYSCLAVKAPLSSPLAPLCTRHHTHEGGTDEEVLFWSWVGSHSSLISSMSSRHLTVKRLKSVGGATFTSTEA